MLSESLRQNEKVLRKAISDVSTEIEKYNYKAILEAGISKIDEVEQVECECCELKEDCTQDFINKTKNSNSGRWVCGLCSEAVKERLTRSPKPAIEEAFNSHKKFCQEFNTTTRLNPKLSITCTMRNIARRSFETRRSPSKSSSISNLARTTSCIPTFNI